MSTCSICLEEISGDYSEVQECSHRFHPKCISQWCLQKPSCPLCGSPLSEIQFHSLGQVTTLPVESGIPSLPEVNFDCLDHAFFQEELGKLHRIASGIKVSKFKGRGSHCTEEEWNTYQAVHQRIETLIRENRNFGQFDPLQLMREMEDLQTTLRAVKTGNVETATLREVYGAEDFEELPSDSDEEDFDV